MKGPEQVQCKFYNELGRILVRDFTPVQLDELQGEPDDNDFHSTSRQDSGKLKYLFLAEDGWCWWFNYTTSACHLIC